MNTFISIVISMVVFLGKSFFLWYIWNITMVDTFNTPTITYTNSMGLLAICEVLFKYNDTKTNG